MIKLELRFRIPDWGFYPRLDRKKDTPLASGAITAIINLTRSLTRLIDQSYIHKYIYICDYEDYGANWNHG